MKRGTRASFEFKCLDRREIDIRGQRAEVIASALVGEVSVLSPSRQPREPLAEVLTIRRDEPKPAPRPRVVETRRELPSITLDELYAQHMESKRVIYRPGIGQVVGVR